MVSSMLTKNQPIRSKKIRESARGETCTLRISGVCNHNPETVVFCHINDGSKGMGRKPDDLSGVYACSSCHDMIDGRRPMEIDWHELPKILFRGLIETQRRLHAKGILILK